MPKLVIAREDHTLELLVGAIRRREGDTSRTVELVLRWDEDMVARKLAAKMREKWWNDYSASHVFRRRLTKKALEDFIAIQEAALREMVQEFLEECETTKISN